jgi:hypothetical protein
MDEDGPITFWLYWKPNVGTHVDAKKGELKRSAPSEISEENKSNNANNEIVSLFEPNSVGPYLQKIDCLTNTYMEESLIDGRCESVEVSNNSQSISKLDTVECWRNIKSRTAMAFIKTRVCGRRFVMENTSNFYLYQTGKLLPANKHSIKSQANGNIETPVVPAKFYEVINNEYVVTDVKNDVREMRVASYLLDKKGSHDAEYLYQANCRAGTDVLIKLGQVKPAMKPIGDATSLSGVAFNRICSNHGTYMKQVKSFTK